MPQERHFYDVLVALTPSPYLQGSIKPFNVAWRRLVNNARIHAALSVKGACSGCCSGQSATTPTAF